MTAYGYRTLALIIIALSACSAAHALDRNAFTFTSYDLRLRVMPASHVLTGEGTVSLRNDSRTPQKNVSLQISSTLDWKTIRLGDKELPFVSLRYETDIDHTGAVTEAIVTLPSEVAPQSIVQLQISYTGTITAESTRLTRIGTPEQIALRNDWDAIGPSFTAVRGVGYVCWYPVAMESVSLSEGNRYFDVLGDWKQREAGAEMRLTVETNGSSDIVANGRLVGVQARAAVNPDQSGTREAKYVFAPLGLFPPTFAVGDYAILNRNAVAISYTADHRGAAEEYALELEKVLPFVTDWFGPEREKPRVIELQDANAAPFDSGTIVFTPLRTADRAQLDLQLGHLLAHACQPPGATRAWISEGLAQFAQALLREHDGGRRAALDWMDSFLAALQLAEKQALTPEAQTQAQESGSSAPSARPQSLVLATDPTYYGIKAMFVWWMLRDMMGDEALQRTIRSYQPEADKSALYMQQLAEVQAKRNLEWFFDGWVYRDRGLPDLRIATVFSRQMLRGNITVTVTVENTSDVGTEVPVTVHTAEGEFSKRMLVQARSKSVERIQVPAQPRLSLSTTEAYRSPT